MYILSNVKLLRTGEIFYIVYPDESLLEITGEEIEDISYLLSFFTPDNTISKEELSLKTEDHFSNDYLDLLLNFLLENKCIVDQEEMKLDKIHTLVFLCNAQERTHLIDKIKAFFNPKIKINWLFISNIEELKNIDLSIDLIIIVSNIFNKKFNLKEIGYYLYEQKINHFLVEILHTALSLGPLVIPDKKTPSILSYLHRRLACSQDTDRMVHFFSADTQDLNTLNYFDFESIYVCLALIAQEVQKILQYQTKRSNHLVAKNIFLDFSSFQMEKSKILKVPKLEIYDKRYHVTPLND